MPLVSVIIPHSGGSEILGECLGSLADTRGIDLQVIIVDNAAVSDIADDAVRAFKDAQILRYECKIGFAAACNRGVEAAGGEYVFLLNNDATVEPTAIRTLADRLTANPAAAACQPKILSLTRPGRFDYSSAAGGELDRFGYPFARGRVFDTLEEDRGQYDDEREVFWGAGAALMIRRELYLAAGGLEETFFAHMEEIDLLWRLQLMGFRVLAVPEAVVHHRGAATISGGSFLKQYLNHRNSLATLFRNYGIWSLVRYLPVRAVLDQVLMLFALLRGDFKCFWAVVRAGCWFWRSLPYLIRCRRRIQGLRRIPDRIILNRLYPRSVAWDYFIRKRRTWSELESIWKNHRTRADRSST